MKPKRRAPQRTAQPTDSKREKAIRQNQKRHRKRYKKNYTLNYIFFGLIFFGTVITLSLTVLFNIEKIEVQGNGNIEPSEIVELSGIQKGDNMFRLSSKKIEKKVIGKNIRIESIKLRRKLPNTVILDVSLSETKAIIRFAGNKFHLSHSNRILSVDKKSLAPGAIEFGGCEFYDFEGGDYVIPDNENKLDSVNAILEAIEENDFDGITFVNLKDTSTVELCYQNRMTIKIGTLKDLSYKLKCAKTLIETKEQDSEFGIWDVSIDGKYYFRPLEPSEFVVP